MKGTLIKKWEFTNLHLILNAF